MALFFTLKNTLKCSTQVLKTFVRYDSHYNVLRIHERGLLQDIFPPSNVALQKLLSGPQCFYAGFDPTAESLHIGNLLVVVALLHCQRAGHQPLAVIGGATAQIGDPSGKSTERPSLDLDVVLNNSNSIALNIQRIFENHKQFIWDKRGHKAKLAPIRVVNNLEWYQHTSFIDFLSKYGRYFRVGTMLGRHSVESRLNSEAGISYTEFSYQVLQAYDWLHLLKAYQCKFQVGGSDQMGNIMSGHDLVSKVTQEEVFGLTLPLVTSESGNKLGKTAGNAVWLDALKTRPFDLYQFFLRTTDADVEKLLKLFTFLPLSEVEAIVTKTHAKPESRLAHRKLAEEVTLLVHGEEGLKSAQRTTDALYGTTLESVASLSAEEIATIFSEAPISEIMLSAGTTVKDIALKARCFHDERDAVRIILAGGFQVNRQKITNPEELIIQGKHILPNGFSLVRVGKKNYYLVKWS